MDNQEIKKTADDGTVIVSSQFNIFALIVYRIIGNLISYIFLGIVVAILAATVILAPLAIIIGVLSLIGLIFTLIDFVAFLFSNVKVTESGVVGMASGFKRVDLTFDQIESMSRARQKTLVIRANVPNGKGGTKVKKYNIVNVKNIDEIKDEYIHQSEKVARANVNVD